MILFHASYIQFRVMPPAFLGFWAGFGGRGLWPYLCQLVLSAVYLSHVSISFV